MSPNSENEKPSENLRLQREIILVRLAGIEPTTPWFVANIFDVF